MIRAEDEAKRIDQEEAPLSHTDHHMVAMRAGTTDDIDWILETEAAANAAGFTGLDPRCVHEAMLAEPGTHYRIADADGKRAGYVIARGAASPERAVEIKRIVMAAPGRGYGRAALASVIREAFDQWRAHRVWLDVFPENARARHVYRSLGFVEEGALRDCCWMHGAHRSLIVMSILEDEYRQRGGY